jgi:hypothetical protein
MRSPIFVLKPNDQGDLVYVGYNKYARGISKLELEDILGKTALQLYEGKLGEIAYEYHLKTYQSGEPTSYEVSLPIDGKVRRIRTRLRPIFDVQGTLTHLIGASRELSPEE